MHKVDSDVQEELINESKTSDASTGTVSNGLVELIQSVWAAH